MKDIKIGKLAQLVRGIVNTINENDIEKVGDFYNIVDLPQSPSIIDTAISFAKENGFTVIDERHTNYCVTILADKVTWLQFNLYEEDDPNYGNEGDVNSLDISKNIYNKLMED